MRVPPSGLWPRPRNQLASPGSARGHAPQGHRPSGLPDRRRRPAAAPAGGLPPLHGGRARRRRRRGNPRTRPPSDLPLGPGRHACLSHGPPARYAAPDPPPQSTLQPGTAGPVASRLSMYSPTPLGWENGGQPLECIKNFPGDPLNYVSGPCTIFFPYKVGHRFGPEVDIERTWSKFGPFHVAYLVRTGRVQNLAYLQERPPRRAPPLHTPSQLAGPGCLVEPAPPTGQFGGVQRSGCVQNSPHRLVGLGGVPKMSPPTGQVGVSRNEPAN